MASHSKFGLGRLKSLRLARHQLLVVVTAFLVLFHNPSFFGRVWAVYNTGLLDICFVLSLAGLVFFLHLFLFNLFAWPRLIKPFLILILPASAIANYFMLTYGAVMDVGMMQNVFETNRSETQDLISLNLILQFLLLGLLPAVFIWRVPLQKQTLKEYSYSFFKLAGIALVGMLVLLFSFNRYYASFFREQKPLRYFANPVTLMVSLVKYAQKSLQKPVTKRQAIGVDADIPESDSQRELIILVVGEAARPDHFSLNGYPRETNPQLAHESVVSFTHVASCGTSTAISVPCMFSIYDHKAFSEKKAKATENVLDVLVRAGVQVLWRDNNSDSKGVAEKVEYQDFKDPKLNPICDVECRDEGMLSGLGDYINQHPEGDILIVLHQMGNHGPAYYKRYPPEFEVFTPTCQSNQLQNCSAAEIRNAYDNAILYTDYFLSKVIVFLKTYDHAPFEVAMIYMGDHGESLGEHGLYLHGVPYFMAPEDQTHVPAIFWFGEGFILDRSSFDAKFDKPISQDYLFHTLLSVFEVETEIYQPELDLIGQENRHLRSDSP
ncbi:MAG: phosphoethanolamine--lipid A transferase [Acidobacteria bacterium]|nr:phosphoethanolamine--lipid A transferase [Acidobacteriota bacterium]